MSDNEKQIRWVVKALTLYRDNDWREILECNEYDLLGWQEYKGMGIKDSYDDPKCADDPPLDPRTYCGYQVCFNDRKIDAGCFEFWRQFKFVGQLGAIPVEGYGEMELTYYPNRTNQSHPYGIKIVPCSADGTATDDIPEKYKYGPFKEDEFQHFYKMCFTYGDLLQDGLPQMRIPSCMPDYIGPMIPEGHDFKIRIHFLGTDGREEQESNKLSDDWLLRNTRIFEGLKFAIDNINAMCRESNTGFTVSLLNDNIWCENTGVHSGGTWFSSAPWTYPLSCGAAADLNIFYADKDQFLTALGSVSAGLADSGGLAGVAMSPTTNGTPATFTSAQRASIDAIVGIPHRVWYGDEFDDPQFSQENARSSQTLFLEEIGHTLGLKWDRVDCQIGETMFHDANGRNGIQAQNYTRIDKKAFEILYLKYKDGNRVFNTNMQMPEAFDAFKKWVDEYNDGENWDGGDGLPGNFPSKHVKLSGVNYVKLYGSTDPYDPEHQELMAAELVWGNLNGIYTMNTSDLSKEQYWEKASPKPPGRIVVSGACGAYGPHDKRWDGSAGGSMRRSDDWNFKWHVNVNGSYKQIWPIDATDDRRLEDNSWGGGMGGMGGMGLDPDEDIPELGEEGFAEWLEMMNPGKPESQGPEIGDIVSAGKFGWTPTTYNLNDDAMPPTPAHANYMEPFDARHVSWQYPVYIKYPAYAKIYENEDGTYNEGYNGIMDEEYGRGPSYQDGNAHGNVWQYEDYSNEAIELPNQQNAKTLFRMQYLKLFVSYYKPHELLGARKAVPTFGPTFTTSDGRQGKALGPTWMVVLSDMLPDTALEHGVAKDIHETIWAAYGGSSIVTPRMCEKDEIIWIWNPGIAKSLRGSQGPFNLDGLPYPTVPPNAPPVGSEGWTYQKTSEPDYGGCNDIKLKSSSHDFHVHRIELQKQKFRPDATCSEQQNPFED